MFTIDEVQDMLDDIANDLPEEFYTELNGGILLLPEAKESPYSKGNLWIMGEYQQGGSMGRLIKIYYGSFMKAFSHLGYDDLCFQLKETLVHEFTHHLESLAGERGLEVWDEEQIKKYLEQR